MVIEVSVIGYGSSAKTFHLPFILSSKAYHLHSIVQRHPSTTNDARSDFPSVTAFNDVDTMLSRPEIDLVVVTAVPAAHYELVSKALNAGKHVLCEKPFVVTSVEAERLAALAEEKGKVLTVYQNRRWDQDFVVLRQLLERKDLGRLTELETHFDRHRPEVPLGTWKTKDEPGNGAIYDLGTHLLDQVVTLFGMPEKVTAFLTNQRDYSASEAGELESGDSFTILLHHPSAKLLVTAKAAVVSAETEQLRFWARGTKGSYKKFGLDPQEDQLKAGVRPASYTGPRFDASQSFGVENPCGVLSTVDQQGNISVRDVAAEKPKTYLDLYEQLAAAIKGTGKNPVTAREATDVLRLIEAAFKSSRTGQCIDL